jgi:hypothetical protein
MWIRSSRRGWDLTIVDEIYSRRGWDLTIVDEIYPSWMRSSRLERLYCQCLIRRFATWLGSIKASSNTMESERRQIKQCWQKVLKIQKIPLLIFVKHIYYSMFFGCTTMSRGPFNFSFFLQPLTEKFSSGDAGQSFEPGLCSATPHPISLPRSRHNKPEKPHRHTEICYYF